MEKQGSLSLAGQIDLCQRQAESEIKIYEDKGFSAKNTKLPAFQALMQDVAQGLIRKLIVYRLDRFSRSTADFGRLWETLQAHGVEFVSVSDDFDTFRQISCKTDVRANV